MTGRNAAPVAGRNAVVRLWRAVGRSDWNGMQAQFLPDAQVRDAGSGAWIEAEEWVARQRVAGPAAVDVQRLITQSNDVAVAVVVVRAGDERRCAAFYDLREGRIARAVEYWAAPGPAPAP